MTKLTLVVDGRPDVDLQLTGKLLTENLSLVYSGNFVCTLFCLNEHAMTRDVHYTWLYYFQP